MSAAQADVYSHLGRLSNILTKVCPFSWRKLDSLKFKAETENSYGVIIVSKFVFILLVFLFIL